MKVFHRSARRLSVMLLCTVSTPAFAQTSAAQHSTEVGADNTPFQEIVVTARRRAESAQNVPSAVLAINSDTLIQRGIKNEADLQTAMPGLIVRASNNQNQLAYSIRGESSEPYSGSQPGVQPYFNDVALSGNTAVSFYDVESVQVLKGPQGTLFGRNSTGGAVLFQSVTPKSELGGFASLQYGNRKKLILEGALNVPLVEDSVLLRVAGTYQSGGAFVHNIYNGSKLGNTKVRSVRATLLVKPTDTISNIFMAQYGKFGGTNTGQRLIYTEPCNGVNANLTAPTCWAFPGNPFYEKLLSSPKGTYFPNYPNGFIAPGGLAALPGYLGSLGKYRVNVNGSFGFSAKDVLLTNSTTFELSDTVTIKNIIGYAKTDRAFEYDNDATPFPFLQAGGGLPGGSDLETKKTRGISEEFQLQGKAFNGKLNYILGAFYSDQKTENNSPITGFGYIPAFDLPFTFALRYASTSKDKTKALFGQFTYAISDELNVTAGLRGTWDTLSIRQSIFSSLYNPATPSFQAKQSDVSWTGSIDYHFTPALMVYATTRGSWRVGGYNPFVAGIGDKTTAAVGGSYFPKETVRDVELGIKFSGRVANVPMRMNVNMFNSWIQNIQKTAYGFVAGNQTSTTTVIPAGKVSGVEIDGDILATNWLRVGATFSYNDARYTKNMAVAFGTLNSFGPFADVAKYSGTAYGEVTADLAGGAGTIVFHVDGFAQSLLHLTSLGNTLNPGDKLPGYVILNARMDWNDPLGLKGLTVSAFIKNLTAKEYYVGGGGGVQLSSTNSAIYGQPQTFGGVLRYSF